MFALLIITLYFAKGFAQSFKNVEFDKNYVGVVFEPYTKYHENRSDYTITEVENMLKIISTRFKWVSTYGMGTINSTSNWNDGHASGLSAAAASHINNQLQSLQLIVNIGTHHSSNDQVDNREISNAFSVAEVANKNFFGTVNGVIISSYQTYSDSQLRGVVKLLRDNVMKARNVSVQLGVRASNCDALSASVSSLDSPLHGPTLEMLSFLNFINCQKLPNKNIANINVSTEVRIVGDYFLQVQKEFATVKSNFTVIGETGWPSFDNGKSKYSSDKSVKFWLEMGHWAKINRFRVDMFTAFDEPWKVRLGAEEAHFGWWKSVQNDTSDHEAFQEKIEYIETEPTVDRTLEIVLGTGSVVFLAMLGGMLFLYKTLISVKKQLLTKADIEAFEKGIKSDMATDTEDALRLPYDRSYEIPRKNLQIDTSNLLGSGAFGSVYKGKVEGMNDDVAFKMTLSNCTATSLKSLLSEIKIMIHVGKHPNVVAIIGACTGDIKKGMIMIAIELCVGGSLEKRLRGYKAKLSQQPSLYQNADSVRYVNAPTSVVPTENFTENCLRWSYEIACGMEHIASKNVIHADLATRNVLLTANGTAKITDFGLSRRMYEYQNYVKQNQEPLPWRWMAIESLKTLTFSTNSDVWSYAVALFEIFSLGDTPYPGLSWTVDFANDLENGMRMSKPNLASAEIYSTMCDCWKLDPAERPSFSNLASFFNSLLYGSSHEIVYDNEGNEETEYLR